MRPDGRRRRVLRAADRHRWTLSDGTVILAGGSCSVRRRRPPNSGGALRSSRVSGHPCCPVPTTTTTHPKNPALLDLWIRAALSLRGLRVVACTYRRRVADLPPAAQATLKATVADPAGVGRVSEC